jgi:hypothetical protein
MSWTQLIEPGNTGNISPLFIPTEGSASYPGDLVLTTPGTGIIVLSPTGLTAWRLSVADDGALSRQQVPLSIYEGEGLWVVLPELSGIGNDWSLETENSVITPSIDGDVFLTSAGSGVILYTPGAFGPYRIQIAEDGAPATQEDPTPINPSTGWGSDFLISLPGAGVVCLTPSGLHSYRIGVNDSGAIFSQQVS